MYAAYDVVLAVTDAFCRDNLTDECRDLARAVTTVLSRKRPRPAELREAAHLGLRDHLLLGQLKAAQPIRAAFVPFFPNMSASTGTTDEP